MFIDWGRIHETGFTRYKLIDSEFETGVVYDDRYIWIEHLILEYKKRNLNVAYNTMLGLKWWGIDLRRLPQWIEDQDQVIKVKIPSLPKYLPEIERLLLLC